MIFPIMSYEPSLHLNVLSKELTRCKNSKIGRQAYALSPNSFFRNKQFKLTTFINFEHYFRQAPPQ